MDETPLITRIEFTEPVKSAGDPVTALPGDGRDDERSLGAVAVGSRRERAHGAFRGPSRRARLRVIARYLWGDRMPAAQGLVRGVGLCVQLPQGSDGFSDTLNPRELLGLVQFVGFACGT